MSVTSPPVSSTTQSYLSAGELRCHPGECRESRGKWPGLYGRNRHRIWYGIVFSHLLQEPVQSLHLPDADQWKKVDPLFRHINTQVHNGKYSFWVERDVAIRGTSPNSFNNPAIAPGLLAFLKALTSFSLIGSICSMLSWNLEPIPWWMPLSPNLSSLSSSNRWWPHMLHMQLRSLTYFFGSALRIHVNKVANTPETWFEISRFIMTPLSDFVTGLLASGSLLTIKS